MKRFFLITALILVVQACATLNGEIDSVRYEPLIDDDDEKHKQSLLLQKEFNDLSERKAKPSKVKVYHKEIPEGLTYRWEKNNITFIGVTTSIGETLAIDVQPGYKHKILSRVIMTPSGRILANYSFFIGGINFDYQDTWRKVLCFPQIPLYFATIGYWGIVPTWYPCVGRDVYMKETAMRDMELAVQAAKGDFGVAVIDFLRSNSVEDLDKEPNVKAIQMLIFQADPRFVDKKMKTTPLVKSEGKANEKKEDESKDL